MKALARQLGDGFSIFAPTVSRLLARCNIQHAEYEQCVRLLENGQLMSNYGADDGASSNVSDVVGGSSLGAVEESSAAVDRSGGVAAKLHVNQQNLQRSWTTRQRSTREDWLEWMRRFSVELLRESPDPALRSCASFAQVYHPLARELFNAAFLSCKKSLLWTIFFLLLTDL